MNEEQKMYRFRGRLKTLKRLGVVFENNPAYRKVLDLYIKTDDGDSMPLDLSLMDILNTESDDYAKLISEKLANIYRILLKNSETKIRREILRIRIEEQNAIRDYKVLEEEAKKILYPGFKIKTEGEWK